jgi:hypothetical protein
MLPLQGFTNPHSKFRVGMDFPQHCWDALQRLGSGGCFGVGFCGSVRQRISEPVLGTSLDDVRCARPPRRVKTQASRANFEPANAQFRRVGGRAKRDDTGFTFQAFVYAASEQDSEIWRFSTLILVSTVVTRNFDFTDRLLFQSLRANYIGSSHVVCSTCYDVVIL